MTAQTQTLIVGGATVAAGKIYYKASWQTVIITAAVAMVAFMFLTDMGDSTS